MDMHLLPLGGHSIIMCSVSTAAFVWSCLVLSVGFVKSALARSFLRVVGFVAAANCVFIILTFHCTNAA